MTRKYPICPDRIRTLPQQFSWVDQRLVRDRYLEGLSHEASTLYLFLVTVADRQGLSYYSDSSLGASLAMDDRTLGDARNSLLRAGLIAYQRPLSQVLALGERRETREKTPSSSEDIGLVSLREIFRRISPERS